MSLQGIQTAEWYRRASSVLISGVSSEFRYWGDNDTIVIDHGEAGHLIDMDNKTYIDYQLGFGPIILGHGDEKVAAAVADAAASGTSFAMTQRREIEAAEKVMELSAGPMACGSPTPAPRRPCTPSDLPEASPVETSS